MSIDLMIGLIGLTLTLMVFTYILGDNVFFRVALTILAGVSAGYGAAVMISKVIVPLLIDPLKSAEGLSRAWALVPLVFVVLLALTLIPRLSTAGKAPLAFLAGVFAALTIFGVTRGTIAPQLLAVINRFSPAQLQAGGLPDWARIFWAVMVLLGVIAVMVAFQQYSRKTQTPLPSPLEGVGSIGQIFIGITLGAIFVAIYSTALIALISRLMWVRDFMTSLF